MPLVRAESAQAGLWKQTREFLVWMIVGILGVHRLIHGQRKTGLVFVFLLLVQGVMVVALFHGLKGNLPFLWPPYLSVRNLDWLFGIFFGATPQSGDDFELANARPLLWLATLPGTFLTGWWLLDGVKLVRRWKWTQGR